MNKTESNLYSILFSNRILKLIILPTEQCNFRCFYCYEEFALGRMNREVIDAIKILINKRVSELDYLQIEWFGGEPLLAKSIILEISSYVLSLTKTVPELHFNSGMSTNGYLLTLKTAEQLVASGIKEFQISLDGPASYHDRMRKRRDGKETFSRIWKNLLDLKSSSLEFKVNLRVHFSKDNVNVINTLVNDLNKNFSHDRRFRIYFKSLAYLGGENDRLLRCFDKNEGQQVKYDLEARLSRNLSHVGENDSDYICYAGQPTSFVIRADGRLAKCTVGLDDPKNQVGFLKNDGTLEIDQNQIQSWFKGAVMLNREFLRCPRIFMQ